jgi:hypothetical protein
MTVILEEDHDEIRLRTPSGCGGLPHVLPLTVPPHPTDPLREDCQLPLPSLLQMIIATGATMGSLAERLCSHDKTAPSLIGRRLELGSGRPVAQINHLPKHPLKPPYSAGQASTNLAPPVLP